MIMIWTLSPPPSQGFYLYTYTDARDAYIYFDDKISITIYISLLPKAYWAEIKSRIYVIFLLFDNMTWLGIFCFFD